MVYTNIKPFTTEEGVNLNKKKLLIIGVIVYCFCVLFYFVEDYWKSKSLILSGIDAKLRSATISTDFIISERVHYLAGKGIPLDKTIDKYNTIELSKYAKALGVNYIYSFIMKNGKVYYTASSVNDLEMKDGDYFAYLEPYPEATEELKSLFKTPEKELVEVASDRWGSFRSILKSHLGYGGQIYVVGADEEISELKRIYQRSALNTAFLAIFLLIIIIPIVLQYEKITNLESENKLNEKLLNKLEFDSITNLPYIEKLWVNPLDFPEPSLFIIEISNLKSLTTYYNKSNIEDLFRYVAHLLSNTSVIDSNFKLFKSGIDEFVLVINESNSYEDLYLLADNLYEEIYNKPFILDGRKIIIKPVISSSVVNAKEDLKGAFLRSNLALNYAHENNLRSFIYNVEDHHELALAEKEIFWTEKLWNALNDDRILPYFQAIQNVSTGKIEKYEALMRFKEIDGKILSPFAFLDIAYKTGLYFKLSEVMIKKTFDYFKDKKTEFSINISTKDVDDSHTKKILLRRVSLFPNPELIVFEIIESDGIDNYENLITFLNEVKKFGCKVALDDFGSGYSNFERISKLPIDYIKVDGSLIKNINSSINDEILVQMIVKVSKKIGVKTIAEFVHSKEVYDKVVNLGIDYAQGYYISEPIPTIK